MRSSRRMVACALGICALATAPALAGPFDAPFTGTLDTEMVSMDLTGNVSGYPVTIRESPTLASLGQTVIADDGGGGRMVADSFFDVFVELSVGPLSYPVNHHLMKLVPPGHPFPPPDFPPPNLPVPPVDPLPPPGGVYMGAPGALYAPDFVLLAIRHEVGPVISRVPIPRGERETFNSTAILAVQMVAGNRFGLPGGYNLLLNLTGPTTVDVTPEPGTLALLSLGALALLRRRR